MLHLSERIHLRWGKEAIIIKRKKTIVVHTGTAFQSPCQIPESSTYGNLRCDSFSSLAVVQYLGSSSVLHIYRDFIASLLKMNKNIQHLRWIPYHFETSWLEKSHLVQCLQQRWWATLTWRTWFLRIFSGLKSAGCHWHEIIGKHQFYARVKDTLPENYAAFFSWVSWYDLGPLVYSSSKTIMIQKGKLLLHPLVDFFSTNCVALCRWRFFFGGGRQYTFKVFVGY